MARWSSLFVRWLLNILATCECISGTDLLRQFYMLPHWDRSCRSNFLPHPATVYWHQADRSQRWPYNARHLVGQPLECQFLSHWYDSTLEKTRDLLCSRRKPQPLGQQGRLMEQKSQEAQGTFWTRTTHVITTAMDWRQGKKWQVFHP